MTVKTTVQSDDQTFTVTR